LQTLPTWFGIPPSVPDDVAAADRSPTVVAALGEVDVGLLTLARHSRYAAEVSVMAVRPALHRRGIGRASLGHAEGILAAGRRGASPSEDACSEQARRGVRQDASDLSRVRFRALEEFALLWDAEHRRDS
jgi:GNAT superfamily N-acetyltransferase